MKSRTQRICDLIGWYVGIILAITSGAMIFANVPCKVLDWPLRPTCSVVEKLNLRPFTIASFR